MNPADFIYDQIYKKCLEKRIPESVAKDHAVMGLDCYKKGKFKKAVDLVDDFVNRAARASKGIKTRRIKESRR